MVPDEDGCRRVSRDGYLKTQWRSLYNASDPEDNGLKEEDYPIFTEKLSTLDHLFMFTNKGNLIHRPVHEITDARWKDTGEHISQPSVLPMTKRLSPPTRLILSKHLVSS